MIVPEGVPYVNADEIAKSLPAGGGQEIAASRILIKEWERYQADRADFAVETTLASRSLAGKIRRLRAVGYEIRLIFLWLPSADVAIARVKDRVARGGHAIPEATIRRRYAAGLKNLRELYLPLANSSTILYNREDADPLLVAEVHWPLVVIKDADAWARIQNDD